MRSRLVPVRVVSLLLVALATPNTASSQGPAPGSPELTPELRERLSQAAVDTLLSPWQRQFMLGLARGDETSALESAGAPVASPEGASITDGSWAELVVGARHSHKAIYDPVRDRMAVLGGDGGSALRNDVWVLALAGTLAWTESTPTGAQPGARGFHSAIGDPVRNRVVVFGGYDGSYRSDAWALVWDSYVVPALISLVSAQAEPGRVTLIWFAPDGASVLATIERRTEGEEWRRIGSVTPDGSGKLTFEDRSVTAGTRYAYRLAYTADDGEITTPEVWVEVPVRVSFALDGLRPNPAVDDLVISFSLPGAEPATLEMRDPKRANLGVENDRDRGYAAVIIR